MELRKNKRDETLNKRRNIPADDGDTGLGSDNEGDRSEQLSVIVANSSSPDNAVRLQAVQNAR